MGNGIVMPGGANLAPAQQFQQTVNQARTNGGTPPGVAIGLPGHPGMGVAVPGPGRKSPLSPFGGAGSSLTGVAQPVAPGTTVPGTEGKGFGLSPGPGQADPASAQRAAQGAAAQNLLGRMSTPERQFPVSPIEGGGTGPGQADPMQTAIARAGGATNGFGYGR